MKKSKLFLSLVLAFLLLFLIEFHFGNNRLGLVLHLKDCNYPSGIRNVKFKHRQYIFEFVKGGETYAEAEFTIDKNELRDWLIHSNFEVVSYVPSGAAERRIYTKFEEIPNEIINGQLAFSFQVLHKNNERTVIFVDPQKVDLQVQVRYSVT